MFRMSCASLLLTGQPGRAISTLGLSRVARPFAASGDVPGLAAHRPAGQLPAPTSCREARYLADLHGGRVVTGERRD
jgi:hypothetical protein